MSGKQRQLTVIAIAIGMAIELGGCALGPQSRPAPAVWDFGPPAVQAPRLKLKSLGAVEVTAPRWIDTPSAWYRLGYANAAQPLAYAQTRWVMPPPVLLDGRLRERLVSGGAMLGGAGPTLRVEVDEFVQLFDSEKASRAVVRARVTLMSGRDVVRQRQFVVEEAAATPDGPGGVAALARAGDRLVEAVLDWAGGS
jgi:ABC-type uncharacterized transport system auxiliary subunit